MMVITLKNASFKYLDKPILNNVNISFDDIKHVGVVGVNGTGKSTLLKILNGEENLKSGTIDKSGNLVISYLAQEPVFDLEKKIIDVMDNLSTKEHPINDYEIKSILNKFKLFDHAKQIKYLSGGERKRLALAQTLIKYADILILDEPTNHLDNDMILYLEKYLKKFPRGIIMVTHDRYFLERVCNKMIELDNGDIYSYDANYSKFLELKKERLEALEHEQKKWNSLYKHELAWMRRGAQARSTKQKGRIKRFEELEKKEFSKNETLDISSLNTRLGKKLVEIYDISKSYGDKVLFSNFSFMLNRSDIVGVVGDNGAGKSTLFKIIMGLEDATSGSVIRGETLKIGYFKQQSDDLDLEMTAIDYIKETANLIETVDGNISASEMLDKFLFTSDMKYTKIGRLSGGERRRLMLIKVLMTNPNLLILDEPTNDLDIDTLEVLEDYLLDFNGPILVVSHDRYFLDKICNRLLAFENGYINEYNYTFSEYLENKNVYKKEEVKKDTRVRIGLSSKEKNELYDLPFKIKEIEDSISKLEEEVKENMTNYHKLIEINDEISKLKDELDIKETRYLELLELKESYEKN